MIATITLTGADERTSIDDLVNLLVDFPHLEIGLLYTANPEGRNRYPSLEWLHKAIDALQGGSAVHICGGSARKQLLGGELTRLLAPVSRIQVNGVITADEVKAASVAIEHPWHPQNRQVITQHQIDNAYLSTLSTFLTSDTHALLVDGSGGRGLSPDKWIRPDSSKRIGFAGGLGPDNLAAELPKIAAIASEHGRSWVDMEGRLRLGDWFDVGLARECAAVFHAFLRVDAPAPARRVRP